MNQIATACPCCQHTTFKHYPAHFSDFIRARVFEGKDQSFELLHCQQCGYAFYTYRFSDEELARLYHNYRDSHYQQQRQKYEPYYTAQFNESLGMSAQEIARTQAATAAHLTPFLPTDSASLSLLDYGGDRGQKIPNLPHVTQKYVYDISGLPAVENVQALSWESCQKTAPFDIILCCHVLEHVTDPKKILLQIKQLSKPDSLLYITLPYDSPFYKCFFSNLLYLFNPTLKWKDLIIHYFHTRKTANAGYAMHEHINFFTPAAIVALLQTVGFEILSATGKPNQPLTLVARQKS